MRRADGLMARWGIKTGPVPSALQVALLKKHHRQQLDTIDSRLHEVLGRKDATIAALKGELGDVHAKLKKFEELVFDAGLQ